MTRIGEFSACAGIAVLVHVGLFVQFGPAGVQSQGDVGQASISLMASTSTMADHVAAWTRPVEAMQQLPVALDAPQFSEPTLPEPRPSQQRSSPLAPSQLALALPEARPQIDTETAKPIGPRHAPEASPRPKTRVAQPAKPTTKPTKPRTAKAAPAATSQKARGGQAGQQAGNAQVAQSGTVSAATRRSLMAQWGASIRNRIERRKRYPSGTNVSGTTTLRITMSRSGRLKSVSIARSSGSRALDKAAIQAVQRARYPAAPKGLTAAQHQFNLPVTFKRK